MVVEEKEKRCNSSKTQPLWQEARRNRTPERRKNTRKASTLRVFPLRSGALLRRDSCRHVQCKVISTTFHFTKLRSPQDCYTKNSEVEGQAECQIFFSRVQRKAHKVKLSEVAHLQNLFILTAIKNRRALSALI